MVLVEMSTQEDRWIINFALFNGRQEQEQLEEQIVYDEDLIRDREERIRQIEVCLPDGCQVLLAINCQLDFRVLAMHMVISRLQEFPLD